MTVIAAARTIHRVGRKKTDVKEAVTIASDSQLMAGWEKTTGAQPKIWTAEDRFAFGACGLVAASQALKHNITWPYYPDQQDWEEWLVRNIRPEYVHALNCAGLLYKTKHQIEAEVSLVIATGTNLASIDGVGGIMVPRKGCLAIGSGYAEALGSLGTKGPWEVKDVVRAAFVASECNIGCGPPIQLG